MAPTAIVIPVPDAEPAVELLRREHTPDGSRGMPPHVTLIYPFIDDSQLVAGHIGEVRVVLDQFSSFEFLLSEVRRFDNLPAESYVWLAPTPSQPFIEIVEALKPRFPKFPPFGGKHVTIVPHLTIAASADRDVLDQVADQAAEKLPIKARAQTVCVMQHVGEAWQLRAEISLARS